jgi:uncharacterized alkaline shock family protein YloU
MADSQDERISGDIPTTPTQYAQSQFADQEGPSVSHVVIATYAADAARSVHGIVDLRTSTWKSLSSRVRETHSGGVVIKDAEPGSVDVEIHARVAWGSVIPELAGQVEMAVRERVTALLNINLGVVTLFVDEIAGPVEVSTLEES